MKKILVLLILFVSVHSLFAQVILEADGPGNTYELINSVFANPGRDIVESPDCGHTDFGRHIDEVFDNELNKNVFQFYIHVSPDNDRCKNYDRQRNEIKSFDDSPENLKGNVDEIVEYKWKFKLIDTFKPSTSFTHIHQIKSVGGSYASIPMITLTLRKSNPDRLELRYTPTNDQNTLKTLNLDELRGSWVTVNEVIKYGNTGSYTIEIRKTLSDEIIFSYTNTSLDMWQDGADFTRPKWGIYRSLNNSQNLQDEIVKFADFRVEEITNALSIENLKKQAEKIVLFPNPSYKEIEFKNIDALNYDTIEMYDYSGRKISLDKKLEKNRLDVSSFSKGLYFVVFKKDSVNLKVLKCYIK